MKWVNLNWSRSSMDKTNKNIYPALRRERAIHAAMIRKNQKANSNRIKNKRKGK